MANIAVDCRMLRASGIGVYLCANLERILAENAHQYLLMGREGEISAWLRQREIPSTRISIINCEAPIYSLREQWEVWKNIPQDCDLFWSPHYVIPLLFQGKMLVTVHDICHLAMPGIVPNLGARIYARLMFRLVAQKAAKIITVSNFSKNEFIKYIKVDERKLEVIHNGYTKLSITKRENKISGPYILYVGNVKPHKNLSRVLAAHSLIFPQIRWPLVIVGKKEGFITGDPELCHRIETLPQGQVYLTGQVSDAELTAYYHRAGFLVLASLYEGFGLPATEAMGAGVPVLASRTAALPEVCGEAALYCDPYSVNDIGEKMALLVNDPGMRAQLAERRGGNR